MAIRVSRQGVEVLYLPDPTIRASRQKVDVLYKEVGEMRVSRQHIEVLRPAPQIHEVSASSTLSLIGVATRAALTLERSASSTLSLIQDATTNKVANLEASNDLVLVQETTHSPKSLFATSVLTLEQEVSFPGVYELSATSILNLTQIAVNSGIISASASSTLNLVHFADTEIKARNVESTLNLTQTATVDKIYRGFSVLNLTQSARTTQDLFASNDLALTQSARPGLIKLEASNDLNLTQTTRTNPLYLEASNALDLEQDTIVTKPIRVSATSELTKTELIWNGFEYVATSTGLRQEVILNSAIYLEASSVIGLTHEAGKCLALATGIDCAASNTLVLTQHAVPNAIELSAISTLVLSQTAVGDAAKPGASVLTLTQSADFTIDRGIAASSSLGLTQSTTYTLILGSTKYQYSPFVGDSTDATLPDPPPAAIDGPMIGIQVPFQLVYPSTGVVTDSVALKTPNLGNKDRLSFQRILQETRGGTLIVYADPIWPKTQTLALTFSGLLRVEAHELLTFIDDHLGLEVGLIDWEHRYWRGVIKTPDEPAIEDKFDSFTVNMQFEGELDSTWNPQVVPPGLRYSAIRSEQQSGYYVPIEPQVPLPYLEAIADDTVAIGYPIYIKSTEHLAPAQANAGSTMGAVGLAVSDATIGESCQYLTEGTVERVNWTNVAGTTLLSPGVFYFLSVTTAGRITSTPPSNNGEYVVPIGRAISQTVLDVEIARPVLL